MLVRCLLRVAAALMLLATVAEGFLPLSPSAPSSTRMRQVSPTAAATSSSNPLSLSTVRKIAFPPRWRNNRQNAEVVLQMNNNMNNNNNNDTPSPGKGLNMDPSAKLLLCILIDLIGVVSFAAPGVGETTDVVWAAISALLVNYLFGNGVFTALALVEELLPGFDIIPTATIAWFVENGNRPPVETTAPAPPPRKEPPAPPPPPPKKRTDLSDAIDAEIIDD